MSDGPKFNRHRKNNNIHLYTGLMNSPIKVLKKIYSSDDMGFETYTTQEICKAWAKVEHVKSGVSVEQTASVYSEQLKFTIYYHPSVDSKCLIEFNGKQYQIQNLENIEQANKFLIITTKIASDR